MVGWFVAFLAFFVVGVLLALAGSGVVLLLLSFLDVFCGCFMANLVMVVAWSFGICLVVGVDLSCWYSFSGVVFSFVS